MSQAEAQNPTGWSNASSDFSPSAQAVTSTEPQPFGQPVRSLKLFSKFS